VQIWPLSDGPVAVAGERSRAQHLQFSASPPATQATREPHSRTLKTSRVCDQIFTKSHVCAVCASAFLQKTPSNI
jgi:hypothetical protein